MQRIREQFNELPPAALSAAWLVAVVLAGVFTWAGFSSWRAGEALSERAEKVVALLDGHSQKDKASSAADEAKAAGGARRSGKSSRSSKKVAAVTRTAERRFFSPAPPQAFRSAQGVLGDRVLYPNGESYAVGDNAMGAMVKKIALDHVELEYEGQTIRVDFGSGGGSSGGSASPSRRGRSGFRSRGRRSR